MKFLVARKFSSLDIKNYLEDGEGISDGISVGCSGLCSTYWSCREWTESCSGKQSDDGSYVLHPNFILNKNYNWMLYNNEE